MSFSLCINLFGRYLSINAGRLDDMWGDTYEPEDEPAAVECAAEEPSAVETPTVDTTKRVSCYVVDDWEDDD